MKRRRKKISMEKGLREANGKYVEGERDDSLVLVFG